MQRRCLPAWAAALVATLLLPIGPGAAAQPRYLVSAAVLQDAVDQRFPMRFSLGGILQMTVRTPVLRMLPDDNRLGADLEVTAEGPGLAAPASGTFDLDFMLRYERSDRSIRATRLRVRSLRLSGLPAPYPEVLDGLRQAMAQQAVGELVLHRLRPTDLALPDSLGLEPGTITVTGEGLVIGFVPAVR